MSSLFELLFTIIFFFFFFSLSSILKTTSSRTHSITCRNNTFNILYPFQLSNTTKKSHNYDIINLKCNDQGITVLTLPFSGDFYIRDIDYFNQKIILYDPDNCLPKRLMNISLSFVNSPLITAIAYQYYTFFSCSKEVDGSSFNLTLIGCLSNSTASVISTSSKERADEIRKDKRCRVLASNMKIPVSYQYENNGLVGDLQLKWNVPNSKGKSPNISILEIIIACFVTVSLAILSTLFCIGCCLRYVGMILETNDAVNINLRTISQTSTNTARETGQVVLPPIPSQHEPTFWDRSGMMIESDDGGNVSPTTQLSRETDQVALPQFQSLPESFSSWDGISWYGSATELLIISGMNCISGPNSDSCSICLDDYQASERLRRICKCDHCFHEHCLDEWLQNKTTCPVCRINV